MSGHGRTYNRFVTSALINRILLVLGWAGVFVAGTLTAAHAMNLKLPCGAAKGCDVLIGHPSSKWFGVPVAVFGLAAYLVLVAIALGILWRSPKTKRALSLAGLGISFLGLAASGWLTFVAVAQIKVVCPWCLASAGIMLVTFLLYAALVQLDEFEFAASRLDEFAFLGLLVLTVGALGLRVKSMDAAAKANPRLSVDAALTPESLVPKEAYFLGSKDAPITIVEYADFYCPACRDAFPTTKELYESAQGRIRLAFRHYPLYMKQGHEQSLPAAMIAELAAEKGLFWEAVTALFSYPLPGIQSFDGLLELSAKVGLDLDEVRKRVQTQDPKLLDLVEADVRTAQSLGINETPTFVVFAKGQPPRAFGVAGLQEALGKPPYSDLLRAQ